MTKTVQTVLGFLLVAIGGFVWIRLEHRGELYAVIVMLAGAHMVSQSAIAAAVKSGVEVMKAWRGQ